MLGVSEDGTESGMMCNVGAYPGAGGGRIEPMQKICPSLFIVEELSVFFFYHFPHI